MAGNKLQSLHRSEGYIYYYRRAIPQSLREQFNNKWEIKKNLNTRDKQVAVIKHNDLNMQIERLFVRARYLSCFPLEPWLNEFLTQQGITTAQIP